MIRTNFPRLNDADCVKIRFSRKISTAFCVKSNNRFAAVVPKLYTHTHTHERAREGPVTRMKKNALGFGIIIRYVPSTRRWVVLAINVSSATTITRWTWRHADSSRVVYAIIIIVITRTHKSYAHTTHDTGTVLTTAIRRTPYTKIFGRLHLFFRFRSSTTYSDIHDCIRFASFLFFSSLHQLDNKQLLLFCARTRGMRALRTQYPPFGRGSYNNNYGQTTRQVDIAGRPVLRTCGVVFTGIGRYENNQIFVNTVLRLWWRENFEMFS